MKKKSEPNMVKATMKSKMKAIMKSKMKMETRAAELKTKEIEEWMTTV